jgi:hypothetical protein
MSLTSRKPQTVETFTGGQSGDVDGGKISNFAASRRFRLKKNLELTL